MIFKLITARVGHTLAQSIVQIFPCGSEQGEHASNCTTIFLT
eukprot:COSAG01_NODE_2690_length_7247_cov_30.101567_3_plen_42_part_00